LRIVGTDLLPVGAFDATDPSTAIIVGNQVNTDVAVGLDQQFFIDNFSLTPVSTVPEPSSLLVLMSLGTIVAVRRRGRG